MHNPIRYCFAPSYDIGRSDRRSTHYCVSSRWGSVAWAL